MPSNRYIFVVVSIFIVMSLYGCPIKRKTAKDPAMATLQIREFQTREFSTNDKTTVMKAFVNVMQDEGFVVKQTATEIGLLSAEKQNIIGKGFVIEECTGNISEFGEGIRVRLSIKNKWLNKAGNVAKILDVNKPERYQDLFTKIEKSIFLIQQGL